MNILIFIALFGIGVIAEESGEYYDESDKKADDDILYHLGSRTPYRFNANINTTDAKRQACPSKIWMFIRHGTNYPSKNEINEINNRLSLIQELILDAHEDDFGTLTEEELDAFDEWVPMIEDITKEKHLTAEGEKENIKLAQRMKKRYPTIFKSKFSNQTYKFRHTNSQRALRSAQAFANGLFDDIKNVHLSPPTEREMEILQFYSKCTKWRNEVDDNLDSLKERNLFESSEIVKAATEDINLNIGLSEDELSSEDVILMYKACGFETAWNDSLISPWCLPFDLDTIKVFEYIGDLRQYWFSGYGYKINHQQACPAFNDMINFFEDKSTTRTATLYFTHSGALLKLLALLGLDRDKQHLLHSNYNSNSERKYRTSAFDNFASNIAFILHGCKSKKRLLFAKMSTLFACPLVPRWIPAISRS